jgi:hypothetical protein
MRTAFSEARCTEPGTARAALGYSAFLANTSIFLRGEISRLTSAVRLKTQERKAYPTDNNFGASDCCQREERSDDFDLPYLKARSLLSYFLPTVFARKGRKQNLGELVEGLWVPRNIERYWRAPHCQKKRQFT